MSWMSDSLRPMAIASEPAGANASGRVAAQARFLEASERAEGWRALEAEHALVVRIEAIGASARGRLADVIEEAIERELDARGAAPPGIGSGGGGRGAVGHAL